MKANKNSLHAKLYRFTYVSELSKSLCPYFWKLVFAFIVFIPNFIIQIPALIMDFCQKNSSSDANERRGTGTILYILTIALIYYIGATYNWIKAMFHCYSYTQNLANGGWFVNLVILLVLIGYGISALKDKLKEKKYNKPVKESIVKEFVKAKLNNYCPKIEWH